MPVKRSSLPLSGTSRAGRAAVVDPVAGRAAAAGGDCATPAPRPFKAEEALAAAVPLSRAQHVEIDLAQLNLAFLNLARELSRSARHLAVTRLGLDAEACAALERLSASDLQALAHSQALIFGLRIDARDLPAHARLARIDPVASEARLVLAADMR